MKKCEDIKDWILTDYIDGQLDKAALLSVESHLKTCGPCSAFLKGVQQDAVLPFQKIQTEPVPAELWVAINQRIEAKEQRVSVLESIVDSLKGFLVFPKLVPAFASLTVMFIVGSLTLNSIHTQQLRAQDQGEYLVSLLSPSATSASSDSNDLGTPIEHYFL